MKHLLYIVGQPGAGKTTAVAHALAAGNTPFGQFGDGTVGTTINVLQEHGSAATNELASGNGYRLASETILQPFAHVVVPQARAAMLGLPRFPFGGTDTLSLGVQPRVIEWLGTTELEYVLAEGDRLANGRFFRAALDLGWDLTVCHISTPNQAAAERRLRRGTLQDPAWVKGRISKVARLVAEWEPIVWKLNGMVSPEQIGLWLRQHPVICALRGELLREIGNARVGRTKPGSMEPDCDG